MSDPTFMLLAKIIGFLVIALIGYGAVFLWREGWEEISFRRNGDYCYTYGSGLTLWFFAALVSIFCVAFAIITLNIN